MSELTELESWKADAIRLLGEKVKAEKERDLAVRELCNIVHSNRFDRAIFQSDSEFADWVLSRASFTLAKIERG